MKERMNLYIQEIHGLGSKAKAKAKAKALSAMAYCMHTCRRSKNCTGKLRPGLRNWMDT